MNSAIIAARNKISAGMYDGAAQLLIDTFSRVRPRVRNGSGIAYLQKIIPGLLGKGMKLEVAYLLWGRELFHPEAYSVSQIWDSVGKESELLVIGAGSLGKSYTVAAYMLLDWLEDPLNTCVKVVSVTKEHAQRNVFAHIRNLHKASYIPLPGTPTSDKIQADEDAKQGIHLVAIPQGENGSGRLQGFHPVPRRTPHPLYGTLSRIRAILDEGEEVPGGVWADIDNMLITKEEGSEHVKVVSLANPRDIDSKFGQRCEPKEGWTSLDIEDSHNWKSKLGWAVVRLDGAKCENVIQKKVVHPGLLTYEGFMRYVKQGTDSAEYYTMARGWFPPRGIQVHVIPREFLENAQGRAVFTGKVIYCAAVDLALEGQDKAVMTVGKYGLASGCEKHGKSLKFDKPKWVLQVETQFDLIKHDPSKELTQTIWLASQIKKHCENLHIKPEYLAVDRTGNGSGIHDTLRQTFGKDVFGVNYGWAATERKILEDDMQTADELYDGVVTELFFAARKFMESNALKISPAVRMDRLAKELTERKFRDGRGGKIRVESKGEFCARGNDSPDFADSLTLLVHIVRERRDFRAAMIANMDQDSETPLIEPNPFDRLEYMSFGP